MVSAGIGRSVMAEHGAASRVKAVHTRVGLRRCVAVR